MLGFESRVSCFVFRVSGFGFRVSGFGFHVSDVSLRVGVSDFGFRVDLLLLLLRECIVVERTLRTNRVFSQSSGY
jgi:hypothetical protein